MNHQEWLEWRRNGIGSSDAPIIMGVSPWKTPYQLWEEKSFGVTDQVENPSMTRGKNLEEVARKEFEKEMNTIVFPKNVQHELAAWVRASLDGIDLEGNVMVEIKCPNKSDHLLALSGKIPDKYFPQLQHQMMVTGLPGMYYYSFDGKEGISVEVERDCRYIETLWKEEQKFWDMVQNITPPEMTSKDFTCLEGDEKWRTASLKWKEKSEALKEIEKEETFWRNELIALSKNKSSEGNGIKLQKSTCRGNIDYRQAFSSYLEDMKKDYPEISFPSIPWDNYRKEAFTKWSIKCIR